jgi:general stress protein YciG
MDPARQREIARMGGRAAHEKGSAHEFSSEEAREAGRKGGLATSRDREHMAAIGREGAEARGGQRRARTIAIEEEGGEEEPSPAPRARSSRARGGPGAFLREDHARLLALFERFEEEGDAAEQRRVVEDISQELELHARVEERVFYPALRGTPSPDLRRMVEDAEDEQETLRQAVAEIEEMDPEDPSLAGKVFELREAVEHHVLEEESRLVPAAEKYISANRLEDLASQMRSLREKLSPLS